VSDNLQRALTDAEIVAAIESRVCPACSGVKGAKSAFCRTDELALTIFQRGFLRGGPTGVDFFETFRSALRHLQIHKERKMKLAADGWRHSTAADMEANGYRFIRHSDCGAPKCQARIVWYRTPRNAVMSVNLSDYQPHRSSCADPGYFDRRRAQTSARRGRR
jgi:hypothetical protein